MPLYMAMLPAIIMDMDKTSAQTKISARKAMAREMAPKTVPAHIDLATLPVIKAL